MATPFLKWPGGKRWVAPLIAKLIKPQLSGTYYEPFLGSGAVFFSLRPEKAVLSDVNEELISTYLAVRRSVKDVLTSLRRKRVSKNEYYRIRQMSPRSEVGTAARLLYLNRTAFGGVYRLNSQGKFNVPYGGGERTPNLLWEQGILRSASKVLARATIQHSDFEPMLDRATRGDVIYCDPTYTVTHDLNGFIRYNETNFSWADQVRLATAAKEAARRGVMVIVSNAHHRAVRALYSSATAKVLERRSLISRDPAKRRVVEEYLFILAPRVFVRGRPTPCPGGTNNSRNLA